MYNKNQYNKRDVNSELDIESLKNYIKDGNYNIKIFSKGGILDKAGRDIPSHQLRRFYSELLDIRDRISIDKYTGKMNDDELKSLKIKLAMIEPLAIYTKSRLENAKYIENFSKIVDFITESIKTINEENIVEEWTKKFERFRQLFEIIIAYSKQDKGAM
ncbi:MAG: type III-A CRISPR-associated protein Csm2 [Thermoplasmata archaeon]